MAGNSECDWAIHDNVVEKCIHWSQKIGVNTYKHRKDEQQVSKRKKSCFIHLVLAGRRTAKITRKKV